MKEQAESTLNITISIGKQTCVPNVLERKGGLRKMGQKILKHVTLHVATQSRQIKGKSRLEAGGRERERGKERGRQGKEKKRKIP